LQTFKALIPFFGMRKQVIPQLLRSSLFELVQIPPLRSRLPKILANKNALQTSKSGYSWANIHLKELSPAEKLHSVETKLCSIITMKNNPGQAYSRNLLSEIMLEKLPIRRYTAHWKVIFPVAEFVLRRQRYLEIQIAGTSHRKRPGIIATLRRTNPVHSGLRQYSPATGVDPQAIAAQNEYTR
jgi:hypothetical protein